MTSPVVNQCLVIGDRKPFVAALVTLDLADANAWLKSQGAQEESDLASLARNPIVHTEVERAVNQPMRRVSRRVDPQVRDSADDSHKTTAC